MIPTVFWRRSLVCFMGLGAILLGGLVPLSLVAIEPMQLVDTDGLLKVLIDGQLFTQYHYREVPRPYWYPVMGPGGVPMTRNWPMKEAPNEAKDHPHHKSLWFTHGNVNGVDFWADGRNKGVIQHVKFLEMGIRNGLGFIQSSNHWLAPDGKRVLSDSRTTRISRRGAARCLDFIITLHACAGELRWGDTKEGSMAIRLAPTMRLKGEVGQGHIVNSTGVRDGATWGQRAAWCDYYGPVQDRIVGVAIFDHPLNPRHPTWWHVRDYGLFAANPFGMHDFERKPAGIGDLIIPDGQSITFRYRFYFHPGNEVEGRVAQRYQEYITEP